MCFPVHAWWAIRIGYAYMLSYMGLQRASQTDQTAYIYIYEYCVDTKTQSNIYIFSCGDSNLNIIYKRTRVCIIQIAINILIRLYCVLSPLFRPHICECRKIGLALLFRFTLLTNYVQFRSLYITWTERICGELEKYL